MLATLFNDDTNGFANEIVAHTTLYEGDDASLSLSFIPDTTTYKYALFIMFDVSYHDNSTKNLFKGMNLYTKNYPKTWKKHDGTVNPSTSYPGVANISATNPVDFNNDATLNHPHHPNITLSTESQFAPSNRTELIAGINTYTAYVKGIDTTSGVDICCNSNDTSVNEWSIKYPMHLWDVSGVTDMNGLFKLLIGNLHKDIYTIGDNNWNAKNGVGIINWNVSSVTDMSGMFMNASSFNQDIGEWDVINVTTMMNMFNGASVFNQDIGDWNTSSVTNMNNMFMNASSFNQDISGWNVSNANPVTEDIDYNTDPSWNYNMKPNWTFPSGK